MKKPVREEKVHALLFHTTVHHQSKPEQELKQVKNLDAGAGVDMEFCLLAFFSWLAYNPILGRHFLNPGSLFSDDACVKLA